MQIENSIGEVLEEELTDAIASLEIDDENEQDQLREMILGLQVQAYERGLVSAQVGDGVPPVSAVLGSSSEEVVGMITALLRDGVATINLAITS
jgi:hypothetical protein